MNIDDDIKNIKMQRGGISREAEKMYCYRCGQMVLIFRPHIEDIRRDPTLDDYIGDHYCAKCIANIVGDSK